ncbi:hypothetical protein B0T24DRAFT_610601 [Lasiosphaeria ovina]|uniref:Uncharacterized protein n=1 Tax=Lasiosphaeria ovina TaxID=92902 RepID=A0AAE0KMV0_9PEZI|nr:hypothetical protein B0T24DRAFT_610601 [Lasiosphaeria ovina]
MPPLPSLLGIPLEVRAMIILLAAQAPQSTLPDPGELHSQLRRTLDRAPLAYSHREQTRRVLFPAHPAANPALPLLLANRQLHDETLDTLRRAFPASSRPSVVYTADIVYLTDYTLWPTWLSVPARAPHVDTVHAQFRIFGCPAAHRLDEPPRGMFSGGAGGPPPVVWPFYHLLVGSMTSGRHAPCGLPFAANRLVLDFLPAPQPGGLLPLGRVVGFGRAAANAGGPLPPENVSEGFGLRRALEAQCRGDPGIEAAARLMTFVVNQLEHLSRLNDSVFEYGKKLHENIGVIEVRLDGKLHETIDLGQCLANMQPWTPSYARDKWNASFLPWRREVLARRRELGMAAQDSPTLS